MAIQTQLKVTESTPGTWRVEERPFDVVVHLYGSGIWECSQHGSLQRLAEIAFEEVCNHTLAVMYHPLVTRCAYAEDTGGGNAEMSCGEIACELARIDAEQVPLCPQHYRVVRNA